MGSSPGEGTNFRMNQRRMYQNQSIAPIGTVIAAPQMPQRKNETTPVTSRKMAPTRT